MKQLVNIGILVLLSGFTSLGFSSAEAPNTGSRHTISVLIAAKRCLGHCEGSYATLDEREICFRACMFGATSVP